MWSVGGGPGLVSADAVTSLERTGALCTREARDRRLLVVDIGQQLEQYRDARRALEEAILPLATSIDGRRFEFQASLHGLSLQVGGYAILEGSGGDRLGQVTSLLADREEAEFDSADGVAGSRRLMVRAARGDGVLLDGDGAPFHDALARPAAPDEVRARLEATRPARAALEIGELLLAPGVKALLDAGGFDRHTFLCGQSGSGKTYSLGLVLERLLLETDLRIVVLDPNSDYVRLGETRADAEAETVTRYAEVASSVDVRSAPDLHLAFGQLGDDARAALLDLDPIADRDEYAELVALIGAQSPASIEELQRSGGEEGRALYRRATNLGVLSWDVWSRGRDGSVLDALERRDARCLVVDLGSLGSREEQAVAAEAVLATLWRRRADREPVLIVIDEAHNVCPQHPEDRVTALATDLAVRIAGEGRKFGLYLLVSTQRPQKVHENVLSQCDNLLLMRMNSTADLGFVADVFSFVPASLLDRATAFRQGEALVAGKVASHPSFVRFGRRIAEEGGADVPADWARPT
jgi:uncharacterized protein